MPTQVEVWVKDSATGANRILEDDDLAGGGGGGGGDASAANQTTLNTVTGAVGDAAVVTDANGTLSAKLRGLVVLLLAMSAKLPASLGIKTAANSLSVAPASDAVFDISQLVFTEDSVRAYGSPVTPVTVNITASGATLLVAAPSAGYRLVVRYVGYSLQTAAPAVCSIRPGAGGTNVYSQRLQEQGQAWARGFHLTEYQLAEATALYGNLSTASDVLVNLETETRAV